MNIRKAKRTRKTIEIEWTEEQAKFDAQERENPLPAFGAAFDALAPVAVGICHLPPNYAEGLRVIGLLVGEQGGVGTIQLLCRKDIDDAQAEFAFKTPARLLATPSEPGKYTPPLSSDDAGLISEAIEQVKAYVRGERAQGIIAFDEPESSEDGTGTEEPTEGEPLNLQTATT